MIVEELVEAGFIWRFSFLSISLFVQIKILGCETKWLLNCVLYFQNKVCTLSKFIFKSFISVWEAPSVLF